MSINLEYPVIVAQLQSDLYVNEMNFVQDNLDLDENVIADLIRRDQNKLDQDLNINEKNFVQPNFDPDEDFIADLIRRDKNMSYQVRLSWIPPNLPTNISSFWNRTVWW